MLANDNDLKPFDVHELSSANAPWGLFPTSGFDINRDFPRMPGVMEFTESLARQATRAATYIEWNADLYGNQETPLLYSNRSGLTCLTIGSEAGWSPIWVIP